MESDNNVASWQGMKCNSEHSLLGSNNTKALFALVKAGLWEKEARLLPFGEVDYSEVYRLAEEQSVLGFVTAGLEHVTDTQVPKGELLQFIGQSLQIEQQNKELNNFIGVLIEKMRDADIYTLMVKGQGIAQCYEKPLWRSCGDVDLFLSDVNYEKAKKFLTPLAVSMEKEYAREKHFGMTIDSWVVELHGRLYCGLSSRIEKELDRVYQDTFYGGSVRSWDNNHIQVFLLSPENDAFYVFTHILQHFYKGGIGLRQICDWCRLLWTYRNTIDVKLLESRIRRAGLMSEWKAFAAYAVHYLDMPSEAMPFYDDLDKWQKKAIRIGAFILEVGNFGQNRNQSYYSNYPYVVRKVFSFSRRMFDMTRHTIIFPLDSIRFFIGTTINGLKSIAHGE